MIKLNFCVNCGATPHYKKKCNNFCSVKCEKEYFNNKCNKKKQNLIKSLKMCVEINSPV